MFSSRGTVRYEERIQGYRDVEKVGKHCLSCIFFCTLYCQLWTLYMSAVGGYETAGKTCDIQKASVNVSIDKMIWYGLRVQRRFCSSSSCGWRLVKNWHWWIRCATVSPISPPGHGLVLAKLCQGEEYRRIYLSHLAVSDGIRLCSTRWCITMNGLYYIAKLDQIKWLFYVSW